LIVDSIVGWVEVTKPNTTNYDIMNTMIDILVIGIGILFSLTNQQQTTNYDIMNTMIDILVI